MPRILLTIVAIVAGLVSQSAVSAPTTATLQVHADAPGPTFDRRIFGQFAEHLGAGVYGGIWVGPRSRIPNTRGYRTDVVQALRALKVPLVRWPGGCFADEYHWRDGVGPPAKRPVKVNTNWGGVTDDNAFGTHEFMGFADLIGAEAYISGDVGTAEPRELAEWMEYMTSPTGSTLATERAANGHPASWKVPLIGIGNELWGCGGNMRPEYAADLTRRYAAFIKAPDALKVASGPNGDDYSWTDTMMRIAGDGIDGIGLHYYTTPNDGDLRGSATSFDESEYARTLVHTLHMDELLTKHSAVMDKYDPQKRVSLIVDEWGAWYDVEPGTNPGFLYQQNSMRDALIAALNLNMFARHADRVRGANIAQMVNVLQAMILTHDDEMVLTPTYHVFAMYVSYQDAKVLPIDLQSPWYSKDGSVMPAVSASAVRDKAGRTHIALVNVDPNQPIGVIVRLAGVTAMRVSGAVLTAPAINTINSFEHPKQVVPAPFTNAQVADGGVTATLPPRSVVMLDLD